MKVITAYADNPSGPGWSNKLIWVVCQEDDNIIREFAIQPEDQTPEMVELFNVCAAAHQSLVKAVEMKLKIRG